MSDESDKQAAELLPCHSGSCGADWYSRAHYATCPGYYRPVVAAALRELRQRDAEQAAEIERVNDSFVKQCETLAERNAEIRHYDDYLHRCNEALGDAGALITEGTIDGIAKIVNERDDLRAQLAAAVAKLRQMYEKLAAFSSRLNAVNGDMQNYLDQEACEFAGKELARKKNS